MRVRSLGGEDPLEKEMATHSGILAWRIPWTEEPGGPQSMGSQKSQTRLSTAHPHTHPAPWTRCSCLQVHLQKSYFRHFQVFGTKHPQWAYPGSHPKAEGSLCVFPSSRGDLRQGHFFLQSEREKADTAGESERSQASVPLCLQAPHALHLRASGGLGQQLSSSSPPQASWEQLTAQEGNSSRLETKPSHLIGT